MPCNSEWSALSLAEIKMSHTLAVWVVLAAGLFPFAGCSRKTDAKTELEKAVTTLSQAEQPAPAAPEPAAVSAAGIPESPGTTEVSAVPAPPPAQQMRQALIAYKAGDMEDAVTRLQKLRMTVALTPQQRMAIQDSVAAVMTEIYGLAERGDARAIAAVKQYEEMQTSRH